MLNEKRQIKEAMSMRDPVVEFAHLKRINYICNVCIGEMGKEMWIFAYA